jgi:hypothetical protein
MSGPRAVSPNRVGYSAVLLIGAVELFSVESGFAWYLALAVGAAGAVSAVVLRSVSGGRHSNIAAALVLLVVGGLATDVPDAWTAGLAGGAVVIALLVWLADEPGRVGHASRRSLPALGIVALAFGVAWVSSFFLPTTPASTGLVAGILVIVVLLAATLFARPEWVEREAPLTS